MKFEGDIGGGMFYAAKVGGEWKIAWDGNGTVTCDDIEPYNFPVSMITECWDEASMSMVAR